MNKKYRIKDKREFDNIIKIGNKKQNKYFVIYYLDNKESISRFGIAVGTKVGIAVTRNKIKRQIREIIRHNLNMFKNNQDYIIIVKKSILNISYLEIQEELLNAMEKV